MGQHTDFTGKCGKPNHKRASPMTYQQCVLQITSPIQAIHSLREVKQKSQCYQCYQAPSLVQVVGTSSVKHHTEFYHQDHWETIKQTLCLYIYCIYMYIHHIYIYIFKVKFPLGFPNHHPSLMLQHEQTHLTYIFSSLHHLYIKKNIMNHEHKILEITYPLVN